VYFGLVFGCPVGRFEKSIRSSRCPLRKRSSTPHNEVDENENIYGQRSDNKHFLIRGTKLPRAAGNHERGAQ
jgi:hypothetical protein